MDKREDGGPAFPTNGTTHRLPEGGMALRDWFAGQALAGLLANGRADAAVATVEYAYAYADTMLQERAK